MDGPEGGTDGWTDGRTDKQKISPFYRILSPIGANAQKQIIISIFERLGEANGFYFFFFIFWPDLAVSESYTIGKQ